MNMDAYNVSMPHGSLHTKPVKVIRLPRTTSLWLHAVVRCPLAQNRRPMSIAVNYPLIKCCNMKSSSGIITEPINNNSSPVPKDHGLLPFTMPCR